jgi:ubiquinone/menaquinone biosynthesis C-methylase UbiE
MISSPKSTSSLRVLADQALPKLWAKYFPEDKLAGDTSSDMIMDRLLGRGMSWWEVFDASEIGTERNLIVDKFVKGPDILDVGCGRGFFTFACAKASRATGLDLMDGGGREGWWNEFVETSNLLGVSGRVSGVRGGATSMPFKAGCFDQVASVHSIRNFGSIEEIRSFFVEARRVLKKGGRLIVAESDFEVAGFQAYKSFYSMRTRLGWELGLPSVSELIGWLGEAGFGDVTEESLATGLRYAPVYFPFDPSSMKAIRADYEDANVLLLNDGEQHPPINILTASC